MGWEGCDGQKAVGRAKSSWGPIKAYNHALKALRQRMGWDSRAKKKALFFCFFG